MSYKWGCINTYLKIQYVQLIPQLAEPLLIQWLGEYVGKLIFGAYTLNANVPFLLMISNEMVVDINVLCCCMLNRIVGQLDCTLIVTQQWHFLKLDSKVIGLHPKNLCTTTTGGYVFDFGG